ncbi:type IV pilin N-terminal domain-containing protein [Methanocalculus sp.]|uniref:type IV pilin N-terminal domain-containing protein n=1 Tax=Methanocalculus sp. TaxID=2004547 RepID=UPI0027159F9B|nr:type IV pilin N-terminal domain-containing protein [Methanocalculus sp.]MDO8841287.1 type IV pilin N-terminal domain-containing protein [Methanocalculus sp.]
MVTVRQYDAVSPVIGVMLMVVVTIIIAATVSVFSTGIVSGASAAPGAQFQYVGVLTGQPDGLGEIGLVFENKGGEAVAMADIQLHLKTTLPGGDEVSISYTDTPSSVLRGVTAPGETRLSDAFTYRMKKIGVADAVNTATLVSNSRINAGERFVIHADRYIRDDSSNYGRVEYVTERGLAGTPYSRGEFEVSSRTTFTLIDKNTGAVISSGTLVGSVL